MNESSFSYLYHYMKGVLVEEGKRKSSVSCSLVYMRWRDEMGNWGVLDKIVKPFEYPSRKFDVLANTVNWYRSAQLCQLKNVGQSKNVGALVKSTESLIRLIFFNVKKTSCHKNKCFFSKV